jgi:hypothetical protein
LERLLQPLITQDNHQQTRQHFQHAGLPTKRVKIFATSIPHGTNSTIPPISNPTLISTSLSEFAFPMHLPENPEQWFGELPDLAAEFTSFQQDVYGGTNGELVNDAFNFGISQDWNWEHMWQ